MNRLKIIAILIMVLSIQSLSAQENESYYFSKTVEGSFEEVTQKTIAELKKQGFGIITEIDMDVKLKEKLNDVDLRPYKILGACNPGFAYKTIKAEENIGLFLPCKVLIKDSGNGKIEVVMVNPSVLMATLKNTELIEIAKEVTDRFKIALKNI